MTIDGSLPVLSIAAMDGQLSGQHPYGAPEYFRNPVRTSGNP